MLPFTELKPKELHTKRLQWTHMAGSLQSQIKTVVISVQEWYHRQITSFFFSYCFSLASPSIWNVFTEGTLEITPCFICGAPSAQHRCISPPHHRAPREVQAHTTNQPEHCTYTVHNSNSHKNSYSCQHSLNSPAAEATGRVLPNLSGHPVRPQWKQRNFTARQTFTMKALG